MTTNEPKREESECCCHLYMKDNDKNITFPDCPVHGKGGSTPAYENHKREELRKMAEEVIARYGANDEERFILISRVVSALLATDQKAREEERERCVKEIEKAHGQITAVHVCDDGDREEEGRFVCLKGAVKIIRNLT